MTMKVYPSKKVIKYHVCEVRHGMQGNNNDGGDGEVMHNNCGKKNWEPN